MSTTRAILDNLRDTLRASGSFADVRIGSQPSVTTVPRAALLYEGADTITPDGDPLGRWVRLKIRVLIATRSDDPSEAIGRLADLADAATAALLSDRSRNGLCHDLPIGAATEIIAEKSPKTSEFTERKTGLAPSTPTHETSLLVRCHLHADDAATYPATTLDGETLFDSGPHTLQVGPWQRDRKRRGFPGLDGELILDFGRRGRTLRQTGRLQAENLAALQSLIDAIDAFDDARPHTLATADGRTFSGALIESFDLTTPPQTGRLAWCDYTLEYRQSS
jgi:hypothetical protein